MEATTPTDVRRTDRRHAPRAEGAGPDRRGNDLVEEHLHLVDHVVRQLASKYPQHVDRDALRSAGAMGLIDAARKFDDSTGIPFARYAVIRIRGAVIDSVRSRDWASRSVRRAQRDQRSATEKFAQAEGRQPTREELASFMGVAEDRIEATQARAAAAQLIWLDQPVGGDGLTVGSAVAEEDTRLLPQDQLEDKELKGTLHAAIALLPETQREVLRRVYFDGELLRDVADSFGVTEARISQIKAEAVASIRAYFTSAWDTRDDAPTPRRGQQGRTSFVSRMEDETTWRDRLDAAPTT